MTTLLDAYADLMESVTWKQRGQVNEYNEPVYSESTISVVWFDDIRMIKTDTGEVLQQCAFLLTTSAVQQGDVIVRGEYSFPVIGMQKTPHWDGEQFRIINLGDRMI